MFKKKKDKYFCPEKYTEPKKQLTTEDRYKIGTLIHFLILDIGKKPIGTSLVK